MFKQCTAEMLQIVLRIMHYQVPGCDKWVGDNIKNTYFLNYKIMLEYKKKINK